SWHGDRRQLLPGDGRRRRGAPRERGEGPRAFAQAARAHPVVGISRLSSASHGARPGVRRAGGARSRGLAAFRHRPHRAQRGVRGAGDRMRARVRVARVRRARARTERGGRRARSCAAERQRWRDRARPSGRRDGCTPRLDARSRARAKWTFERARDPLRRRRPGRSARFGEMRMSELTREHRQAAGEAWRLEDAGDGIKLLVFDAPGEKVNILSETVLRELERVLDSLASDSTLRALIVIGGKEDSGTFIAGANVHEIREVASAAEATEKARLGQAVLGRFATLPAVTIAAIHGTCLGGGTELALACDLRIASHHPKARIGLPEVQLGILPGFGGTQRLPRLVGLTRALPIILTGKPQSVEKAAKIGLADRVVYPPLLRDEAIAFAKEALANGGKQFVPRRPKQGWMIRSLAALPVEIGSASCRESEGNAAIPRRASDR